MPVLTWYQHYSTTVMDQLNFTMDGVEEPLTISCSKFMVTVSVMEHYPQIKLWLVNHVLPKGSTLATVGTYTITLDQLKQLREDIQRAIFDADNAYSYMPLANYSIVDSHRESGILTYFEELNHAFDVLGDIIYNYIIAADAKRDPVVTFTIY